MTLKALLMYPACCRWHFAVLGWKDGPGYLYNGLALLFSFVVSRIVLYGLGLLHLLKLRYVTQYGKGLVTLLLPTSALNLAWLPLCCISRCHPGKTLPVLCQQFTCSLFHPSIRPSTQILQVPCKTQVSTAQTACSTDFQPCQGLCCVCCRHLWLQPSIPLGYKVVVALFGLGNSIL